MYPSPGVSNRPYQKLPPFQTPNPYISEGKCTGINDQPTTRPTTSSLDVRNTDSDAFSLILRINEYLKHQNMGLVDENERLLNSNYQLMERIKGLEENAIKNQAGYNQTIFALNQEITNFHIKLTQLKRDQQYLLEQVKGKLAEISNLDKK